MATTLMMYLLDVQKWINTLTFSFYICFVVELWLRRSIVWLFGPSPFSLSLSLSEWEPFTSTLSICRGRSCSALHTHIHTCTHTPLCPPALGINFPLCSSWSHTAVKPSHVHNTSLHCVCVCVCLSWISLNSYSLIFLYKAIRKLFPDQYETAR